MKAPAILAALGLLMASVASCQSCSSTLGILGSDASATEHISDAGRASWPPLPTTDEEARVLLLLRTPIARREKRPLGELEPAALLSRIDRALAGGHLVVGNSAMDAWIAERAHTTRASGQSFFLLWGTHHDSSAQVEAFRRLTSATARTSWDRVIVEQLRADGRWGGIGIDAQRGDDADLERWFNDGSRVALVELRASQERDDYAAWKFDYVESVLGIVTDGRAAGHAVDGCDMPLALQAKLGTARPHASALRELHCALALGDRRPAGPLGSEADARTSRHDGPHAIAALWGAQHVGPDGFFRFLPSDASALAVRLIGGRPSTAEDALIRAVGSRFDLTEPILLPPEVGGTTDAVVILPEDVLATSAHFERKRVRDDGAALDAHGSEPSGDAGRGENSLLLLSATEPVEVRIDGALVRLTMQAQAMPIASGHHVLAAPRGRDRTVLASFLAPSRGSIDIRVERTPPEVTLTVRAH